MITYNNIVNRFERFVADHLLLKTFTHGSPSGVDLEKFEVYPALHLVYTGATYENTSKEYSFEVYILDLPPDKAKKIENQTQLVSNAEQVAEDILADMMNGGNVFNFSDLYTVTNASTTPLEETTSNSLAGILLTIGIEVGYAFDSCNAPLSGVTPSGSTFPVAGASGLRIVEVDGSPDVSNVTKIIVSNGTLVDNGSGVVTLTTGGGGGGTLAGLTDVDVTGVANNNTLVYDSATSKWVDGYPSTTGLISTFIAESTKVTNFVAGGGIFIGSGPATTVGFGSLLNPTELSLESSMKAGWTAGFDAVLNAKQILCAQITSGSTIKLEMEYDITLGTATTVYLTSVQTGIFGNSIISFPLHTASESNVVATGTAGIQVVYQTSNTVKFEINANGTGTFKPLSTKITIVHA